MLPTLQTFFWGNWRNLLKLKEVERRTDLVENSEAEIRTSRRRCEEMLGCTGLEFKGETRAERYPWPVAGSQAFTAQRLYEPPRPRDVPGQNREGTRGLRLTQPPV